MHSIIMTEYRDAPDNILGATERNEVPLSIMLILISSRVTLETTFHRDFREFKIR